MAEGKTEDYRECDKTLLIDAIDREDIAYITFLINTCGLSVNEYSRSGRTPLAAAVVQENINIVRILLQSGASCNSTCFVEGGNVLHYAVKYGLEDIVDELIMKNVTVNEKNQDGLTALMIGAQRGNLRMIEKLMRSECDFNAVDRNGSTAVMISVKHYLVDDRTDEAMACVQELINADVDLNISDEYGNNALMQYSEYWDEDTDELMFSLIRGGCDVNHINNDGDYPLMSACDTDMHSSVIEGLIAHGAVVNGVGDNGYTPLAHVCGNWEETEDDCMEICEILLKAGADPNMGSPVVAAAHEKREQLVKMLLNYGANVNCVHHSFGTVLLMGGYKENEEIVKIALKYNAEINIGQAQVNEYPDIPETANKNDAIMLMAAAGELYPFEEYSDEELPEKIVEARDDLSLMNMCRKVIRNAVIMRGNNENMFDARTKMGLPSLMEDYLVFDMSLLL